MPPNPRHHAREGQRHILGLLQHFIPSLCKEEAKQSSSTGGSGHNSFPATHSSSWGGRGERWGEPCRSFSFSLCPQRAHLGQGTRTNIYDGVLNVCSTAGADDEAEYFSSEPNNNSRELHVVLKVLDPSHRDIALVSPAIFLSIDPGPWAASWCSPAS